MNTNFTDKCKCDWAFSDSCSLSPLSHLLVSSLQCADSVQCCACGSLGGVWRCLGAGSWEERLCSSSKQINNSHMSGHGSPYPTAVLDHPCLYSTETHHTSEHSHIEKPSSPHECYYSTYTHCESAAYLLGIYARPASKRASTERFHGLTKNNDQNYPTNSKRSAAVIFCGLN